MTYDSHRHRRRSIRLQGYDYTQAGAYFVTMRTHRRECLFGKVVDGDIVLSEWGEIAREEWLASETIRREIELDAFVIMPNHVHGIVWIIDSDMVDSVGATGRSPLQTDPPRGPAPRSLGSFIAGYKSAVTKRINGVRGTPGAPVWQRGYYDHIIRNDVELDRIRGYIADNPARWDEDHENPVRVVPAATDREPYPWEED